MGRGVVLHTGKTPRAAKVIALYTILTSPLSLVLTLTVALPFLCKEGLVRLAYYASVPKSAEESTQVVTALRRELAGGPFLVLARLRIC